MHFEAHSVLEEVRRRVWVRVPHPFQKSILTRLNSMILPSLLFHYSFTCVQSSISHGALAVPPAAQWYSYLAGSTLAGLAVVSSTIILHNIIFI